MSPLASWSLVTIVVGLPTLMLYCALVLGRRVEEKARRPLHRHTCSSCGRIQRWSEPFDQFSPCRACQIANSSRSMEIDLDDFADADAIRVYLNAAASGDSKPSESQTTA